MTIEELMELTGAELKAKADGLGIEYSARANKTELSELIYAKTNNPEGASEVAQATETNGDEELELGNGVFYVPGQKIILKVLGEDGELVEQEYPLDDLYNAGETILDKELLVLRSENETLRAENERLKASNSELEKSAYREVIGHPSQAPEEPALVWSGEDQMTIRARVMPNKGITNRIRGGHDFTLQYQTITVDKALFDVLSKDQYIQIDAVSSNDE